MIFFRLIVIVFHCWNHFQSFEVLRVFFCQGVNYSRGKCLGRNRPGKNVRLGILSGWEITRGELPPENLEDLEVTGRLC